MGLLKKQMVALNPTILIIKLIANKKGQIVRLYKKEIHFKYEDKHGLKVKEWKKINHNNTNQKKAGMAILISDMVGFTVISITKDKGGHFIMINIEHQINKINTKACTKQTLIKVKGEIHKLN